MQFFKLWAGLEIRLLRLGAALLFIVFVPTAAAQPALDDQVKQTWQMLDYLAVDYGGAVQGGRVVKQEEYAEMQEFAATVQSRLAKLPDNSGKSRLLEQARALRAKIADKADAGNVATAAQALAADLLSVYPVPIGPASAPSLERGARLYQAQCASCHGVSGHADGPLAAKLEPRPIAFADHDRAKERSVFSLYETVSRGVEGTSMPAFASLSEEDRWALAFFSSTLAYSDADRQAGAKLWSAHPELRAKLDGLGALVQQSESSLAKIVGSQDARPVLAYLRANPQALDLSQDDRLALAKQRLRESLQALLQGDTGKASRLALSSYLDGFEPVEAALAVSHPQLFADVEKNMGLYRTAAGKNDIDQARALEARLQGLLAESEAALTAASEDRTGIFLGALTIIVREGLEALLILAAMAAFLKKAGREDVLPYVHAGWAGALAAGGATWFAATYFINISGASREVTEGVSALFACAMLLTVGIWMHHKSVGTHWQAYIRDKLSAALNRRSALMLFVLAFVTVYREVFETILFYAAMWSEGAHGPLLAGFAAGSLILAVLAWVMLKTSARLPLRQFFAASSALVAILAIVLAGKGIAALQEAGVMDISHVAAPRIDLLGFYPTRETIAAQFVVLLVVVGSMLFNRLSARNKAALGQSIRH